LLFSSTLERNLPLWNEEITKKIAGSGSWGFGGGSLSELRGIFRVAGPLISLA
jgi:hypothetical protein